MKPLNKRGLSMVIMIVTAVLFSVAAFAAINMSLARAQRSHREMSRFQAQYAAEAGLVWAMEKLWVEPTWSSGPGTDLTVGTMAVDISMPSCARNPCEDRVLRATVSY